MRPTIRQTWCWCKRSTGLVRGTLCWYAGISVADIDSVCLPDHRPYHSANYLLDSTQTRASGLRSWAASSLLRLDSLYVPRRGSALSGGWHSFKVSLCSRLSFVFCVDLVLDFVSCSGLHADVCVGGLDTRWLLGSGRQSARLRVRRLPLMLVLSLRCCVLVLYRIVYVTAFAKGNG